MENRQKFIFITINFKEVPASVWMSIKGHEKEEKTQDDIQKESR